MNNFINSPTDKKQFQNQTIYIKRDDLLSQDFSGNKARKFHYYLAHEFPHIQKVLSYGSAQSNAMYSISVLAKKQGWEFDYYTTHIADYLKENPHGNYKYALENGMKIYVEQNTPVPSTDKTTLFVEEGGRQQEAEYGLEILAKEIESWKKEQHIEELNIFLPSGTGTTALFLQKYTKDRVYTTPCVGGVDYLKKQFLMLEKDKNFHPNILTPSKKRHFGKLYRESYNIWLELQDKMGIEFDLLYDPHGWLTLLENPQIFEKPTLYIHQGGLIGNESMLARYQRKYSENI
jgi:1-aminocyclopropane-1-carboxylate deaminase/D-cysteine desulfhydrase-like pyridoxal-dependent ACC family enzyme